MIFTLLPWCWLSLAVQGSVVVFSAIVDNQTTLCKEEAVRLDLPRRFNDFLHFGLGELWHIIAELPLVCAVRDDKAKPEAVVLDHAPAEVMPLDHLKVLDGLRPDSETHRQADRLQVKEVRAKMILDQALGGVVCVSKVIFAFDLVNWDIYECDVRDHVSNLEALELELRPVFCQSA